MPVFVQGFCDPARRHQDQPAAVLASAMGFIDGSVVSLAVPAIRETLGASLAQVTWVNNAYALVLAALVLVGGAAGDRFGLARVFGGGIVLFVAASMACALAPTAAVLIAARALQGLGAALMIPGSLAIISRAYPREIRGAAIGTWAAASAITTAAGPIIGASVLTYGGPAMWRLIFAVNLPLGGLAVWLLIRAVRSDPARPDKGLDLAGAGLAALGLGLTAYALTGGSEARPAPNLPLLALGLGVLAAFVWSQTRIRRPMVDLALFASRAFATANVITFTFYFGFSAVLFFLPMVLISGWGVAEIWTGLAFAPLAVFIGGLSRLSGRLADAHGTAPLLVSGMAVVALAFAALGAVLPLQDFWRTVLPCTTLMGIGMGLTVAPLSQAVMGAVAEDRTGAASGINNAVARMAGLLAVAAMGALAVAVYGAAGGPLTFGAPETAPGHVAAMNTALRAVVWTAAALAVVSSGLAWAGLRRG